MKKKKETCRQGSDDPGDAFLSPEGVGWTQTTRNLIHPVQSTTKNATTVNKNEENCEKKRTKLNKNETK